MLYTWCLFGPLSHDTTAIFIFIVMIVLAGHLIWIFAIVHKVKVSPCKIIFNKQKKTQFLLCKKVVLFSTFYSHLEKYLQFSCN